MAHPSVSLGMIVLGVLGCLAGCKGCERLKSRLEAAAESERYWSHGCVTRDWRLLAVSGDGWAAIDLDAGRFLLRHDQGLTMNVKCEAKTAKVYAMGKTVLLPGGEEQPESDDWRDDQGSAPDGTSVRVRRSADRKGRPEGYPTLTALLPGRAPLSLELVPALFGAVGAAAQGPSSSWVLAAPGLPKNGRQVLLAGWAQQPWAFFMLDLASGLITPFGPIRAGLTARSLSQVREIQSIELERAYLLSFVTAEALEVTLFDPSAAEPVWAVPILAASPSWVELSPPRDRILVRTELGGAARMQLQVVEVPSGRQVWSSPVIEENVFFSTYLADGSFVYATSKRKVFCMDRDGKPRWTLGP